MNRRALIAGLGGAAAWPLVARAQQSAMPVVGFVDMRYDDYEPLALGLSETGYVDHRNVFIDRRIADHVDQLPAIGAELGRSKVSVICGSLAAITAAKAVTTAIPMVFIGAIDPVGAGLVASFNRPGGNVTGVRLVAGDLPSKQVQIVREFIPKATKFGLLISPGLPNGEREAAAASDAAHSLGLTPIVERVMTEGEFEPAFMRFRQEGVDAVLVITNLFFASFVDRFAMLALRAGLPCLGNRAVIQPLAALRVMARTLPM